MRELKPCWVRLNGNKFVKAVLKSWGKGPTATVEVAGREYNVPKEACSKNKPKER